MRLRRLGGLALLLLYGSGCGASGIANDYSIDTGDVIPLYDMADDGAQPDDQGFQPDDTSYIPDDIVVGDDNPYVPDDTPDILQYDVDNWDVDSPFDVVEAYDFGKDIPNDNPYVPDDTNVGGEDLYQLDEDTTGDSGDVVDPCAPVAKACSDDRRDPITGKCYPIKLFVDSDNVYTACLDFGDSSYEDSYCFDNWAEYGYYHIPGHPTGSHTNCGRKINAWYLYDGKGGLPVTGLDFAAGDQGTLFVGLEDETEDITYDYVDYSVKKKN